MFLSKSNAPDVSLHLHKLLQTLVYTHISTPAHTQILKGAGRYKVILATSIPSTFPQ